MNIAFCISGICPSRHHFVSLMRALTEEAGYASYHPRAVRAALSSRTGRMMAEKSAFMFSAAKGGDVMTDKVLGLFVLVVMKVFILTFRITWRLVRFLLRMIYPYL